MLDSDLILKIALGIGGVLAVMVWRLALMVKTGTEEPAAARGAGSSVAVYSQVEMHRDDRERLDKLTQAVEDHARSIDRLAGCVEKVGRELEFQSRLRRERE